MVIGTIYWVRTIYTDYNWFKPSRNPYVPIGVGSVINMAISTGISLSFQTMEAGIRSETFGELRPEKRAKVRGQYYSLTLLHSDTIMQDSGLKSSLVTRLCINIGQCRFCRFCRCCPPGTRRARVTVTEFWTEILHNHKLCRKSEHNLANPPNSGP